MSSAGGCPGASLAAASKMEPAKAPVSVRMCSQQSANALARGSSEAMNSLYRSSDLKKSSPAPTASTRCSAKPGRMVAGIRRMRASVSPPVQMNADLSTTARALFSSLALSTKPTPSVRSGYTPGSDEHGPGFNRGSGGGARGCDFEERVRAHARPGFGSSL